jgi:hypothetical protein
MMRYRSLPENHYMEISCRLHELKSAQRAATGKPGHFAVRGSTENAARRTDSCRLKQKFVPVL